ncbi:MAG: bifunctional metallophosphatase/5'-nucleotidase [Gemmatimonadaceae bacterium]|nr:bifunctional metallophosphatase/5'-nucleotidase [Gemmatimonadaceae bacterium]
MSRPFVTLVATFALLGLAACASGNVRPASAGSAAGATSARATSDGTASFTILHFNDVYEITPVEGGRAGGLARVATLRRQLADSIGPVLTTLGGDFVSPSALGTAVVDGTRLAGKQMIAVLNAVGLDWTTLGNHEFDIPEAAFRARLAESRFRYVASNVRDSAGRAFPGIVPHVIIPLPANGRTIRVGLVGVVLPANPQPWVRYDDPLASLQSHAAMIRDSVDVLVALTHLAIGQDQQVAETIPSIDLILGGHEHENYLLQRGPRFTPIIKGDANVRTVAVVRVSVGGRGERPHIASTLVRIDESLSADSAVDAEVGRWIERGFAGYRSQGFAPESVVATLRTSLDGRENVVRTRAGSLSDAIVAAMRREASDAEVAIFNGGSIRIDDVIPAGPISQYDVIRILPFGGITVRADMSGRLLRRVLSVGRDNVGSGGFLHASGAAIDADGVVTVAGAPIEDDRQYRVVTTDFLLSGNEKGLGFLTRTNPELRVVRELRDIRQSLIDELRRM